ncbi:MAG TPA: hypothetical protein PKZ92_02465 [Candidatus Woesebacteria bacterium]|jgi:methionyl-tRNA synthetase|nr:hypothetical protein [Candidatus Shapirobacteria bacterium]HOR02098.1 hypothetical protein [Candidatus Woesebacteria bacterium]
MDQIKYDDFAKVEFKIGKITEVVAVEGSEKLLRMRVDFGEDELRVVFSGIKKWYQPKDLINKKTVFVTNIEPRKIMGELSEAMIFAASNETLNDKGIIEEEVVLLFPENDLPAGSKVF